jgi:uncharacterized membrane protein YesL
MDEKFQGRPGLARALEVFGNVFVLNVLFVIFCIPVVTVGASLTALYSMTLKMVNKEEPSMVKGFIRAFKKNFKKATIAWAIVLAALVAIWGEMLYISNFEGTMANVYMFVVAAECIVLALTVPLVFPLIARFENTMWNTFQNAFLLSVSNLWAWVKIFLAWFAPIFLSLYYPSIFLNTWYLWLIIVFGLIAYGTSVTINKIFERVTTEKEKKIEKEEEKKKKNSTNGAIRKRAMLGSEEENDANDIDNHSTGDVDGFVDADNDNVIAINADNASGVRSASGADREKDKNCDDKDSGNDNP